jgi:hypothetical protein
MKTRILRTVFTVLAILPVALLPLLFSQAQSPAASRVESTSPPAEKRVVAPDTAERLAKFKNVKMPFDDSAYSARERQMILKLVDAAQLVDDIYWRQSDVADLKLYLSLANSKSAADVTLRRYLWINGSRFDLIDENRPFVGTQAAPPGRGFYPADMTRKRIEDFVAKHPERRADIYNSLTVIRETKDGDLEAIPYHVAYKEFLEPMAQDLVDAAVYSDDPAFSTFLRLRSKALLTDDYYPSDIAWLELKNPKFDLILAPYESYTDGLLGVKTTYGASILIRNEEQSQKLETFQKFVPELQESLPLAAEDLPSKRGKQSPMEVMDAPFRTGDLGHGYQAVADNLPNDPRVHEQKGSKKIFFKNFMDARVEFVILPVAQMMMMPEQAALVSGDGYLASTLMHEISHGLGPAYARTSTGRKDIREAIGPAYSALEESKADVVGMLCLKWLVDHRALPKENLNGYYASYVAGNLRSVRFGVGEAHSRGEMMEFNFLSERGAIAFDPGSQRYAVQFAKMPAAIAELAKKLLEIEATGDRQGAEEWFDRYGAMPAEMRVALKRTDSIPVDIDPVFSFPNGVR